MASAANAPTSTEPSMILWDLVGSCNLKCPSCPMGSMRTVSSKGFITAELFEAILVKLQNSLTCRQLHFYNWTEPLLHPRLAEYCLRAADSGFHVHVSSNLNHLPDAAAIMTAGIKTFRISLSGFTQEQYRVGHRGGDVERVKANMVRLAEARQATSSRTRVHVYFHKYRHNVREVEPMQRFAHSLGFDFQADWAFLMPIEKILAYADGSLAEDERAFADAHFVPRLDEALSLVRAQGGCSRRCTLIEQLVLDHRGRALLCCGSFDDRSNVIGEFLDMDWPTLQRRRHAHSMCDACMAVGAHSFCTSVSDAELRIRIDDLAVHAISQEVLTTSACKSIPLPIVSVGAAPPLAQSA